MAAVQYKIVLIGDAGVGKSTFFQRLRLGDGFDPESMGVVTLGADSFDYNCTVDGTPVKVSGQERGGVWEGIRKAGLRHCTMRRDYRSPTLESGRDLIC